MLIMRARIFDYLAAALTLFTTSCIADDTTVCQQPVTLPIGNVSLINGYARRGFVVEVGSAKTTLSFMPGWAENNTYIYGISDPSCPADDTSGQCLTYRGGFYDNIGSTSRNDSSDGAPRTYLSDKLPNLRGPSTSTDSNFATFSTDNLDLGSNATLEGFPFGVLKVDPNPTAYQPQHILGLGNNSTVLAALQTAGRIASRSWGMYWGKAGVTTASTLEGSLVLGGYDRAKTTGSSITGYIGGDNVQCPSQILVTISGLTLNLVNGTDQQIALPYARAFQACIMPHFPLLMTMPTSLFDVVNLAWHGTPTALLGRSTGVNFWGVTYNGPSPYSGDFTLQISSGGRDLPIRISNDQLFMPDVHIVTNGDLAYNDSSTVCLINPLPPGNDQDLVILGRTFLSAAYLAANLDKGEYRLWAASGSTNSTPIAVDTQGNEGCAPKNSTADTTAGVGNAGDGGAASMTPASRSGLGKGIIAGITVGAVALLAIIVVAIFLTYRRSRSQPLKAVRSPALLRHQAAPGYSGPPSYIDDYYKHSLPDQYGHSIPSELYDDRYKGPMELQGEVRSRRPVELAGNSSPILMKPLPRRQP